MHTSKHTHTHTYSCCPSPSLVPLLSSPAPKLYRSSFQQRQPSSGPGAVDSLLLEPVCVVFVSQPANLLGAGFACPRLREPRHRVPGYVWIRLRFPRRLWFVVIRSMFQPGFVETRPLSSKLPPVDLGLHCRALCGTTVRGYCSSLSSSSDGVHSLLKLGLTGHKWVAGLR